MKKFSLPRLLIVLFFFNYMFFSLVWYLLNIGRHLISGFLIYALLATAVELVGLGLIEDIAQ